MPMHGRPGSQQLRASPRSLVPVIHSPLYTQPCCHPRCSYGWGSNAAKLELPEGVGFSVGGETSIKYIVAQVRALWASARAWRGAVVVVVDGMLGSQTAQ